MKEEQFPPGTSRAASLADGKLTAGLDAEPSAAREVCKGCYETADVEPVQVKRDGVWVDSTIRRCVNRECHAVREGTLEDRVAHINSVYGYKYFGDYELAPHQMDMVGEAVMLANRVPRMVKALRTARLFIEDDPTRAPLPILALAAEIDSLIGPPGSGALSKAEGRS